MRTRCGAPPVPADQAAAPYVRAALRRAGGMIGGGNGGAGGFVDFGGNGWGQGGAVG